MTTPENLRQSAEVVPKVHDAELVSDNHITSGDHSPRPVLRHLAVECTGYVVRRVRESDQIARLRSVAAYRARKAPRDLARLVWFLLRGHGRWIAKGWIWATHGDLRADVRVARLAGDAQARREAHEAIRADAEARWAKLGIALRRMALSTVVVLAVLVLLGLGENVFGRAAMPNWLVTIYQARDFFGAAVEIGVPWLLTLGPIGWAVAAAWEGRDRTPGAGWLNPA